MWLLTCQTSRGKADGWQPLSLEAGSPSTQSSNKVFKFPLNLNSLVPGKVRMAKQKLEARKHPAFPCCPFHWPECHAL